MPARIETGRFDAPDDLRSLLRNDPDAVEPGFRILDVDVAAGDAGCVDLLGLDRHETLTLITLADRDPDAGLVRLLDAYRWAREQYHLLVRAYAPDPAKVGHEGDADRGAVSIRLLCLAPAFPYPFVRRLQLLNVPVTPMLARAVRLGGETRLLIEPAAPLFGLEASAGIPSAPPRTPPDHRAEAANGGRRRETPLEEAERAAYEMLGPYPGLDSPASSGRVVDREFFTETLSPEELDEFEQFDVQRHNLEPEPE